MFIRHAYQLPGQVPATGAQDAPLAEGVSGLPELSAARSAVACVRPARLLRGRVTADVLGAVADGATAEIKGRF